MKLPTLLRTPLRFLPPLLALGLLALGSCGNAGTPRDATVTVSFTDAAADDVESFEVDVKNVTLTGLDGSVAALMTDAARIDFAQLETLGEVLVGATIPLGVYTKASMTLDFSSAQVQLVGHATPAAVLDPVGNPISGDVVFDVTFDRGSLPVALASRNHVFEFDLDLNQSLAVDLTGNKVTFTPVATASFDPLEPKPRFMNGDLTGVDTVRGEFTLDRRGVGAVLLGTYTVRGSAATVYQIDGINRIGSAGLAALAALTGTPRVFVQGTLDPTTRIFDAASVETGIGTPGNGQDWVHGLVTARDNGAGSDAALTVLGMAVDEPGPTRTFDTSFTVNVSLANTKVLRRLDGTGLTTDDVNVGQRVMVFGTLSGTTLDATTTEGVVRLLRTSVWGTAKGPAAANVLTLDLTRIGRRPIGAFNFSVGGTAQADPANYTLDVTGIATAGIGLDSKVRAFGGANPVDVVGDSDFAATTLVDRTRDGALLLCQWFPSNSGAIRSASSTGIEIDVASALIKDVGNGFGSTTLSNTPTFPLVKPLLAAGIYRIVENNVVQVFFDFSDFASRLSIGIPQSKTVFRISALGRFDSGTQVLDAVVVSVIYL